MTTAKLRRAHFALPLLAFGLSACATTAPVETRAVDAPVAVATAIPVQPSGATAWGNPVYDIPADPAVRYGVLDNGMKYAILRNDTPEETGSIRLGFDVGWVDEYDSEIGLAHLIEHMAFNGSINVPEGEMIKLLEREGLAFGPDTNASTGFEDTIYKLDLPRNDAELLDTGLMLMRETASNLTLAPDAIDRERGIILSETRTRNNFQIRRFKDYFEFVSPGTKYATRFRADGTSENVERASAETVRGLYERYYRPDNATLVVVGAFDPEMVEREIRERFSDWQKPSSALEVTELGAIALDRPAEAHNFVDPDVQYIVSIDRFAPYVDRPDSVAGFRESLLVNLGTAILNRRIERIANAANAPILGGGASSSDFFELANQASMTIQGREGDWQQALRTGEQEWRRAVQYGFTSAELAEQLANFETRFRNAADQAAARRNNYLAEQILSTERSEDLFTTPQTRLAIFQQLKADLTADAVGAAFREHFAGSEPLIHVSTKEPVAGGEQAILAEYNQSSQIAVSAPQETQVSEFAYTDFGTPGSVVASETIDDLDVRTIRFDNNVLLNLKPTTFEEGKLRYRVRIGEGILGLQPADYAVPLFMNSMFAQVGLGQHSYDELQQILAGRQIAYGLGVASDHFHVSGTSTMRDFPLQMQVSTAYLTDPGYRAEAQARWEGLVPPFVAQLDSTPQSVAGRDAARIAANDDPRFGIPAEDQLLAVTLEQVRQAVDPLLADAPIEITVVGEFDEQQVIDAVAQTFAALPERRSTLQPFDAARQVSFASDLAPVTLYHAGEPDQALIQTYWPTSDDDDYREEITLNLLARVMDLELNEKIREELGATYSPQIGSSMSDVFDDYGTLQTSVIVNPGQADEIFEAVDEIAAELARGPVDQDLLARARTPYLERVRNSRRENSFWLSTLDSAQLRSERLDRIRQQEALIREVTPEQLQAAAARYLDRDKQLRIRIIHQSLKGA